MKIFRYMALALAAVVTMGCAKEYMEVDPDKVPTASELQVKIDVDQATNYVTFSIENEGMVPMWLFGEEQIDGKPNKKYAYTGNGLELRIRDAGTHSVEVKAFNAHGVSVGSKVVDFTLENTYRDPFDPSKYVTFFAGSDQKVWEWNSTVKGHMGCGEPGTEGTNWWSAGPDEKKDCGLYDDRLTFTKDMKYTYNPGEGGTVYVNKDSGYGAELNPNDGNDYQVPIEGFTTSYSFENAWNDAGIEEVYLVLPANTNLSYIPNPDALADPRYRILEGTNTKKIALSHDNGSISWKYEFIVEGSAKPADPKPDPGEVVFDPNSDRNLWKSAVMDVSFWFANNDWGQIENPAYTVDGNKHTIVIPEGIGTQRWQGQMVFNNTGIVTSADKTYDFQLVLNSTADHSGVTIKLTQQDDDNVFFFEDAHAVTAYEEFKYQVKGVQGVNLTNAKLVLDFGGATPGATFEIKDIVLQEHIEGGASGPAPFDPSSPDNLWNSAVTTDHHFYFANNDWGAIENATVTSDGGTHTFVLPDGLGGQQWQGQFFFQNTGLKSEAAKTYDFHLVLNSTADHPGVTVKLCSQTDDGAIITDGRYALTAYEDFVLDVYAAPGIDCENLKLVFDFGGGQGGSTVVVKDIVFREAKTVGGGGGGSNEPVFDPADPNNLWNSAVTTDHHFWFANNDWGEIDPATVTSDGGTHTFVLPDGIGGQQWQGQFFFQNTGLKSEAAKTYDFYLVMNSDADHPGVTVKLCAQDDDGAIITDGRYALSAYEDFELKVTGAQGIDCENLKLVFDFGGGQGGSTVVVKDIIFRESQGAPAPPSEPEQPSVLDPNSDANLWKTANTSEISYWFADANWTQIADPEMTAGDNEYTLIMPEGIGGSQWQGQFVFNHTGIVIKTDNTYDFQVTLYSEADHPHVTVKPCYEQAPSNDVNELLYKADIALSAYEEYVYTATGLPGTDIPDMKLVFDFGGAVAGSKVVVSGITIIEH
ncbi:MAG: hypothetical protein IJN30_05530 [Bacteroidales bacterium]|nr:hypothetical protein [Bacteroidales bacterium]